MATSAVARSASSPRFSASWALALSVGGRRSRMSSHDDSSGLIPAGEGGECQDTGVGRGDVRIPEGGGVKYRSKLPEGGIPEG